MEDFCFFIQEVIKNQTILLILQMKGSLLGLYYQIFSPSRITGNLIPTEIQIENIFFRHSKLRLIILTETSLRDSINFKIWREENF